MLPLWLVGQRLVGDNMPDPFEQDLLAAEASVKRSAAGRGQEASASPRGFMPKALRFKGKIMGEKELSDFKVKTSEAFEQMADIHGMIDKEERRAAKFEFQKRMNTFGLDLVKKSMEHRLNQVKRGVNEQNQETENALFNGLVSGGIEVASRYFLPKLLEPKVPGPLPLEASRYEKLYGAGSSE